MRENQIRQVDLAEWLELSQPTISHYLTGRRVIPPEIILRLEQLDPLGLHRSLIWPDLWPLEYWRHERSKKTLQPRPC